MLQDPLAPDLASPVKVPLLAVILTPSSGRRESSRRKPLIVSWNCWFDGGGVGAGVAACDAGAAISRSATTADAMAPHTFSSPAGRRISSHLGGRLKIKTSTWGWLRLRHCSRCERRMADIRAGEAGIDLL